MGYIAYKLLGRSRLCTMSSTRVCYIHTYLVGPSWGAQILLLQVTTKSMWLRGSTQDRKMSHKNTRGKTIYQVQWRSHNAIEDDWLRKKKLNNASHLLWAYQLRHGIWLVWPSFNFWYQWNFQGHALYFAGASVRESMFYLRHISGQLGWNPLGEGFLLLFVIWVVLIPTRMRHPLGVGHSGGGECEGYCPGGL